MCLCVCGNVCACVPVCMITCLHAKSREWVPGSGCQSMGAVPFKHVVGGGEEKYVQGLYHVNAAKRAPRVDFGTRQRKHFVGREII